MRIGILVDNLLIGGVQRVAVEETRYLTRLGYKSQLLVLKEMQTENLRYRDLTEDINIDFFSKKFSPLRYSFRFPGFSFFSLYHLTSPVYVPLVLSKEYNIIVAHGTYTCFTAYSLRKIRNMPYIGFIHDPITYVLRKVYTDSFLSHLLPVLSPIGTEVDRLIADAAEVVMLQSKYHLNLMKKLTRRPIEVVYPGVEAVEKIPNRRGDYLIAVARWEHGKKPLFLLDVIEKLKKKGHMTRLVMVGPWKSSEVKESFIKNANLHGLSRQIDIYGSVGGEDLKKLYLGARALIHPTIEAFGMTALEASACGAPMIIPKGSGVTDLFIHGVHGFFPQEGNIDEYAECTLLLIENERLAWKMGSEAWRIAKQCTWRRHAEKLGDILQKVT